MALKFHENFIENLLSMLKEGNDCDIIIRVGSNQDVKEFPAHSNILKARSTYFKTALSEDWIVKENDMTVFPKPNISPETFELILKYIYTGEVDISSKSGVVILNLLVASDELLLDELVKGIQNFLTDVKPWFIREHSAQILNTTFKIPKCKRLIDYCVESICVAHVNSDSFESLSSLDGDILYELLKRDDLLIEESVIWENLVKWGIRRTPGLGNQNSGVIKWNNKGYEALKETLKDLIPLVRFSEISSADFYDKVLPFRAIIPNNVYEEAMIFYMKGISPKTTLPPRIGEIKIESQIIKSKLAYIIANWIDGNDAKAIRKQRDGFTFKLLYRCDNWNLDLNTLRNQRDRGPYFILVKQRTTKNRDITSDNNNFSHNVNSDPNTSIFGAWRPRRIISSWPPPQPRNINSSKSIVSENGWHYKPDDDTSAKIYGEYDHVSNGRMQDTSKNFVFSFEDDNDTKNMKISRSKHRNLYENDNDMRTGRLNYYHNQQKISSTFYIDQDKHIQFRDSNYCYNNLINPGMKFVSYEVEIFQVIKTVK